MPGPSSLARFAEAHIGPTFSRRTGLLLLLMLGVAPRVQGQEPDRQAPAADGDSLVSRLPGELTGTLADSTAQLTFPTITDEMRVPADGWAWATYDWDRDAILRSNALTFLDLVSQAVPGFTSLRATWFGGPHQIVDGALGPGFVSVSVDGRELTTLDAGQVDFTRIALANVDRVRVRRRADGWVAEITTLRRDERRAYSRITGGTGEPDLNRLKLVFSNGLGDHFNVGTSIDLLDTSGDTPSNDFNFWGRVEWLPGGGDAGIELHWVSESVERRVYDLVEFGRNELFLRGRGNLGDHLQAEAFVGTSSASQDGESLVSATNGGFRLSGDAAAGWFRATMNLWDDPAYATLDTDLEVGYRVRPWLSVSGGGRLGSWDEFSTSEVRAGVAASVDALGLTLTADAATGVRGVAYPTLERADSVSYDVAAGGIAWRVGPFTLSGRGGYQSLGRQLPFGAVFDRDQEARGPVEVGIAEGGLAGPVVPLDLLLEGVEPIRIRGFWRYANLLSDEQPWYLPANVSRAELFWTDSFFEEQLEIYAGLGLNYRDAMLGPPVPESGGNVSVPVPAYTFVDWNLMIRVLDVRIYWRFDNLTVAEGQDFAGLPFPVLRSAFGVTWEFLN